MRKNNFVRRFVLRDGCMVACLCGVSACSAGGVEDVGTVGQAVLCGANDFQNVET